MTKQFARLAQGTKRPRSNYSGNCRTSTTKKAKSPLRQMTSYLRTRWTSKQITIPMNNRVSPKLSMATALLILVKSLKSKENSTLSTKRPKRKKTNSLPESTTLREIWGSDYWHWMMILSQILIIRVIPWKTFKFSKKKAIEPFMITRKSIETSWIISGLESMIQFQRLVRQNQIKIHQLVQMHIKR